MIGSGLGGLTCANRLAKNGWRILVLEHHIHLGGLAAWFRRKKHVFDVALHGFPVGMIKTCRKYWSKEIASQITQLKGIRFDNPQFQLETTYDRVDFTRLLIEKFGITAETVDRFFNTTTNMNFFDDDGRSIGDLFQDFFPGREDVWRLLMEPITYANGSTLEDPAITYGIVFSNFMSHGVYTFPMRTDIIIKMMEGELYKNGVDIRVKTMVEKVVFENGRVAGVIANGKMVRSKTVVSNSGLKATALELVDKKDISEEFREKTNKVRVNTSSCQVYFGIREGISLDYIGDLIFTSTAEKFDTDQMLSKEVTSRTYSVYYSDPEKGRATASIVASSNARFEDWADLPEKEYVAEKERLAEETFKSLSKYVPNIREIVDHVEVSTPRTFKRYTLHEGGSSFGTKFEGLEISKRLPEEAPGLFHTGSVAIIMSGWLGAANYGVIVANEVDKLLRS